MGSQVFGRLPALAISTFLAAASATAQVSQTTFFDLPLLTKCTRYQSPFLGKSVGYCVDRSRPDLPRQDGEPVLYFLHGAFMSARQWYEKDWAKDLKKIGVPEQFPAFTVVSLDSEMLSFFSDEGDMPTGKNAYESWFLREFMPMIEGKLKVCGHRECRGLIGVSMGGFGTLKIGLKHPELFSVLAAAEAAILPENPYDRTMEEWGDYFADQAIGETIGKGYVERMMDIFPSREIAAANDPVDLIYGFDPGRRPLPAIYFDVTGGDQFGFDDGYRRFKRAMDARGFRYRNYFEPTGDHFDTLDCRTQLFRFTKDVLGDRW